MSTITESLSAFAIGLDADAIREPVRDAARLHLLDVLGCALAADALGEQSPVRALVGTEPGRPVAATAFLAGALAHALDFDDTHAASVCHVSAVVAPAAFACAHDDSTLLSAYVAGCEVTIRLGMAASGEFHRRGLHPTSVCGVFGATAAAARLLVLDAAQVTHAFGLAGSRAAGVLACLAEGVPVKPLHAAAAARDGVECALLARAGAVGPRAVLEGHQGVFEALLGDGHEDTLRAQVADLGERFEMPETAFKALPVCHFMHGALEAVTELRLEPGDVAEIEVAIDEAGVGLVLEPIAAKRAPDGPYGARFALPWCVAATVLHGPLTPEMMATALDDAAVLELAGRVRGSILPSAEDRSTFAGRATVVGHDGSRRTATVEHPLGSPQRPMSEADVRAKFRANAGLELDAAGVAALEARVAALR